MNENFVTQNEQSGDKPSPVKIDRLIHEPARYNIMANLYTGDVADFFFLIRQTGLTWGNLSAHLRKLETAGYIVIRKEILGKKPHTLVALTPDGRLAFQTYRKDMIRILCLLPLPE
jgi:DNA-binding MarR family transcriptional regulator